MGCLLNEAQRNFLMPESDSPLKEAVEIWFEPWMRVCFSAAAAQIDWTRGFIFLDKELQELMRDSASGLRVVDKLAQVWLLSGKEEKIYLHLELQGWRERGFEERMYLYKIRLQERLGLNVASFVILADHDPRWRPSFFEAELLGDRIRFDFPSCKLLDLLDKLDGMGESIRPVAVVILANWAAQETRHHLDERYKWKLKLALDLYEEKLRPRIGTECIVWWIGCSICPSRRKSDLSTRSKATRKRSVCHT